MQHDFLFRDAFVDDIAQALAAGFGGERHASAADGGHAVHDAVVNGSHAQGGQRKGNLFLCAAVQRGRAQRPERRVVARAQGQKADFIESGLVEALLQKFRDCLHAPLTGRPVYHSGVTEAAEARAAAGDFQGKPVVYRGDGDDLIRGIEEAVKISHHASCGMGGFRNERFHAAVTAFPVERGYVDARYGAGRAQKIGACGTLLKGFFEGVQEIHHGFLAISQDHEIEEWCHGFCTEEGTAAGDDQRAGLPILRALSCVQGDTAAIQHVEDVGIAEFVCDGKTHQVHILQIRVGFEGGEACAGFPEYIAVFPVRLVAALGPP